VLLLLFTDEIKIRHLPPNKAVLTPVPIPDLFVFDDVVEISSGCRQNHLQLQLAGTRQVMLAHNAFDFLLRSYAHMLEKFAQR